MVTQTHQKGFTLIELVVVMVILGILAAVAVPQFISLRAQARIAALAGLQGAIDSSVNIVRAAWYAAGNNPTSVTLANGNTVAVGTSGTSAGIPLYTSTGISNAVALSGFTYVVGTAPAGTFDFATAIPNCNIQYNGTSGISTASTLGC